MSSRPPALPARDRHSLLDARQRARRHEVAQALLPAVGRLLADSSYRELTVEQISAAGGISRSTFYSYFADKGDLLQALTSDTMGSIIEVTQMWWTLPSDASRDEFTWAIRGVVEAYATHAPLMKAVGESVPHDPGVREAFLSFMALGTDGIATYVRKGQADGRLDATIDAAAAAHWLTWMLERGLSKITTADGPFSGERAVDALVELIWSSLRGSQA